VLLPDGDLDWASYEGPDSLAAGPRGLLEPGPAEPRRGPGAIARADLVLVPALAADRSGNRLGKGGGSYDRALARVGGLVPTVALLFDGELLDEVPAGPHDVPVRLAAQPGEGIIRPAQWVLPFGRQTPRGLSAPKEGTCRPITILATKCGRGFRR